MFEHLIVSHPGDKILQITLNRPRQFNAIARQTIAELIEAIQEFEASSDHVLVLTGSGRAFCFGADFQEFEDTSQLSPMLDAFQNLIRRIYFCPKITLAVLNGFATGAGFDLALACDFRLAAEKIKVGEAYIGMGLVPDGGGTFFLPQQIGMSRALELLITGESIPAEEGLALGLIHKIFPAATLQTQALEYAAGLASKPQTAVRLIKQLVKSNPQKLEEALSNENRAQQTCFQDEAHLAIVRDFLAKRKKGKRE
jgi:2-(1,2-epoxy-1,2-dihydrophenyl)acetyl-CoA isomerase